MLFPYSEWDIPEECLLEKRVYKKLFYENADLTVTDKKWFTKDIDNITWMYTIKPELTLIREYTEADYTYDEIAIVDLDVETFQHTQRLSDIIHRAIPYPLMIVFRLDDQVQLSVAEKRYSKTDAQAATINQLWVTDPFTQNSLNDFENAFIQQLAYPRQPQLHLKAFYRYWIDAFLAYEAAKITGQYALLSESEKNRRRRSKLAHYHEIERQVQALKSTIQKKDAFNRQVELNQEIKELEVKLTELAKEI